MLRVRGHVCDGNLMYAPEALQIVVVDLAGASPALGAPEDDHGPLRSEGCAGLAGFLLVFLDLDNAALEGGCHCLVHRVDVVAFHEIWLPAVSEEELFQLLVGYPRQHSRIVDLVAVQVQNGQHGAIDNGVEELVAVPCRCQRASLGLAVAHHGQSDEVRVVEHRAESVRDGVAELTTFVDAARSLGRGVRTDAAGEGKLLEEPLHATHIFALVRIYLRVHALEISLR